MDYQVFLLISFFTFADLYDVNFRDKNVWEKRKDVYTKHVITCV